MFAFKIIFGGCFPLQCFFLHTASQPILFFTGAPLLLSTPKYLISLLQIASLPVAIFDKTPLLLSDGVIYGSLLNLYRTLKLKNWLHLINQQRKSSLHIIENIKLSQIEKGLRVTNLAKPKPKISFPPDTFNALGILMMKANVHFILLAWAIKLNVPFFANSNIFTILRTRSRLETGRIVLMMLERNVQESFFVAQVDFN